MTLHFNGTESDGYRVTTPGNFEKCHIRPVVGGWQASILQPVEYRWYDCGGWGSKETRPERRDIGTPQSSREKAGEIGIAAVMAAVVEVRECLPEEFRRAA